MPRLSLARRLPVGVVGVIAPFNVPTILVHPRRGTRAGARQRRAAQARPAHRGQRRRRAGRDLRRRRACPTVCCTSCPAAPRWARRWSTEPAVRVIAFTGSTRAGRAVAALAAQHLKRVHLELGGNSALLVLDDVDVEAASSVGAWGSFAHQGQVCMTAGRHLVQSRGRRRLRRRRSPPGPTTCRSATPPPGRSPSGRSSTRGQRDQIHAMVTGSVDAGRPARRRRHVRGPVLPAHGAGGRADQQPGVPARRSSGRWPPWSGSTRWTRRCALATDSAYGLSLGILTRDVMRGLEIAEPIPSGLVHINDQTVNDEATIPFGGVQDSGTGSRQGGAQANLDAFTDTQWVTVRGTLPQYPM